MPPEILAVDDTLEIPAAHVGTCPTCRLWRQIRAAVFPFTLEDLDSRYGGPPYTVFTLETASRQGVMPLRRYFTAIIAKGLTPEIRKAVYGELDRPRSRTPTG